METKLSLNCPRNGALGGPVRLRGFGMTIQPSGVAALWGAEDPSGTIYFYAEHQFAHPEPSENARAIKQLGGWIPGPKKTLP
jgi:hypothetical protein